MKRTILVGILFASLTTWAHAAELNLKQGTMQLGGTAGLRMDMSIPEEGDSKSGFVLDLSPTAGYFVIDNLELIAGLGLDLYFGDLYENASTPLGFDVGARYFVPLGRIAIYFGAMFGMDFDIPEEGDTTKSLTISAPAGVLLALNEHVGLDLGLRIVYEMSLEDGGGSALRLPMGYAGVQAFF